MLLWHCKTRGSALYLHHVFWAANSVDIHPLCLSVGHKVPSAPKGMDAFLGCISRFLSSLSGIEFSVTHCNQAHAQVICTSDAFLGCDSRFSGSLRLSRQILKYGAVRVSHL